jgi:nitrogen fixation-related uncharacterized protein
MYVLIGATVLLTSGYLALVVYFWPTDLEQWRGDGR